MNPVPYRLTYSGHVLDTTRDLLVWAGGHGLRPRVAAAVREIDRLLKIYPQFGQPLRDLSVAPLRHWVGVVAPVVVHYILDEDRRAVTVLRPFQLIGGPG